MLRRAFLAIGGAALLSAAMSGRPVASPAFAAPVQAGLTAAEPGDFGVRASVLTTYAGGSTVLEVLPARGESVVTIDVLGVTVEPPSGIDVYTMFSAETVFRLE